MKSLSFKNKKYLSILFIVLFVLIFIGAAYAYFGMVYTNAATETILTGDNDKQNEAILTTNTTELILNLTEEVMAKENAGKTFYATPSGVLVENPSLNNGKYVLATASVTDDLDKMNCTYTYDISATVSKEIKDNSGNDIKVKITESSGLVTEYTLNNLLEGVTHSGLFEQLQFGENQTVMIEAYIYNDSIKQNGLSSNTFEINIEPREGEEGFKCDLNFYKYDLVNSANGQNIAQFIVDNYEDMDFVWNSNLEEDGIRYDGTSMYNETSTPNNFICFGTKNLGECLSNAKDENGLTGKQKYLYRIIGIFPDESGNQHLKLIKFNDIGEYQWHSDGTVDISWEQSDLYNGLNGNYFLNNVNYDYLQDILWLNKIENWRWTAVKNGLAYKDSGPGGLINYNTIYLHEMNRSTKTSTVGEWSYPVAKIGLLYVSDLVLSSKEEYELPRSDTLRNTWLKNENNVIKDEWTMTKDTQYRGPGGYSSDAYFIDYEDSYVSSSSPQISNLYYVRPVFYLTSDAKFESGNGSLYNPYIIQ